MWQKPLQEFMESLTSGKEPIYSGNGQVYYDGSNGDGFYVLSTAYHFGDDFEVSADGTTALYYIYLHLSLDLDDPKYPFSVTMGSHIRKILKQFGVSSVSDCSMTDGICTLLDQGGKTVVLRQTNSDDAANLQLVFSETYTYPRPNGPDGTMTRTVTFCYDSTGQTLQQISIELNKSYPRS